jgi:hypothetical protein
MDAPHTGSSASTAVRSVRLTRLKSEISSALEEEEGDDGGGV